MGGRKFKSYREYAFLAQLVERKTFNLVVVGSSPTEGMINYQSNSEEKVSFVIVLWVMFPSGQRGATQDRLHYASWVRIPSLPRVLWCSRLACRTLNPATWVRIPAEPFFWLQFVSTKAKGYTPLFLGSNPRVDGLITQVIKFDFCFCFF